MLDDLIPIFPDDFLPIKKLDSNYRFIKKRCTPYFLKYEVAVEWLRKSKHPMRVKSSYNYREYAKHPEFPAFLPLVPDKYYLGKGWVSWAKFLSTQNVHPPTVYKNMTPEMVIEKKKRLCEVISLRNDSDEGYKLLSAYIQTNNSTNLFRYFNEKKYLIRKIVHSIITKYNLPYPPVQELDEYFNDSFFSIISAIDEGRFIPEKLGNRITELYSWMATFVYMEARKNITGNGKKKIRINEITERYNDELHSIDNYE